MKIYILSFALLTISSASNQGWQYPQQNNQEWLNIQPNSPESLYNQQSNQKLEYLQQLGQAASNLAGAINNLQINDPNRSNMEIQYWAYLAELRKQSNDFYFQGQLKTLNGSETIKENLHFSMQKHHIENIETNFEALSEIVQSGFENLGDNYFHIRTEASLLVGECWSNRLFTEREVTKVQEWGNKGMNMLQIMRMLCFGYRFQLLDWRILLDKILNNSNFSPFESYFLVNPPTYFGSAKQHAEHFLKELDKYGLSNQQIKNHYLENLRIISNLNPQNQISTVDFGNLLLIKSTMDVSHPADHAYIFVNFPAYYNYFKPQGKIQGFDVMAQLHLADYGQIGDEASSVVQSNYAQFYHASKNNESIVKSYLLERFLPSPQLSESLGRFIASYLIHALYSDDDLIKKFIEVHQKKLAELFSQDTYFDPDFQPIIQRIFNDTRGKAEYFILFILSDSLDVSELQNLAFALHESDGIVLLASVLTARGQLATFFEVVEMLETKDWGISEEYRLPIIIKKDLYKGIKSNLPTNYLTVLKQSSLYLYKSWMLGNIIYGQIPNVNMNALPSPSWASTFHKMMHSFEAVPEIFEKALTDETMRGYIGEIYFDNVGKDMLWVLGFAKQLASSVNKNPSTFNELGQSLGAVKQTLGLLQQENEFYKKQAITLQEHVNNLNNTRNQLLVQSSTKNQTNEQLERKIKVLEYENSQLKNKLGLLERQSNKLFDSLGAKDEFSRSLVQSKLETFCDKEENCLEGIIDTASKIMDWAGVEEGKVNLPTIKKELTTVKLLVEDGKRGRDLADEFIKGEVDYDEKFSELSTRLENYAKLKQKQGKTESLVQELREKINKQNSSQSEPEKRLTKVLDLFLEQGAWKGKEDKLIMFLEEVFEGGNGLKRLGNVVQRLAGESTTEKMLSSLESVVDELSLRLESKDKPPLSIVEMVRSLQKKSQEGIKSLKKLLSWVSGKSSQSINNEIEIVENIEKSLNNSLGCKKPKCLPNLAEELKELVKIKKQASLLVEEFEKTTLTKGLERNPLSSKMTKLFSSSQHLNDYPTLKQILQNTYALLTGKQSNDEPKTMAENIQNDLSTLFKCGTAFCDGGIASKLESERRDMQKAISSLFVHQEKLKEKTKHEKRLQKEISSLKDKLKNMKEFVGEGFSMDNPEKNRQAAQKEVISTKENLLKLNKMLNSNEGQSTTDQKCSSLIAKVHGDVAAVLHNLGNIVLGDDKGQNIQTFKDLSMPLQEKLDEYKKELKFKSKENTNLKDMFEKNSEENLKREKKLQEEIGLLEESLKEVQLLISGEEPVIEKSHIGLAKDVPKKILESLKTEVEKLEKFLNIGEMASESLSSRLARIAKASEEAASEIKSSQEAFGSGIGFVESIIKSKETVKSLAQRNESLQREREKFQGQASDLEKDVNNLTLQKNEAQIKGEKLEKEVVLLTQQLDMAKEQLKILEEAIDKRELGSTEAQKIIQGLEKQTNQLNEKLKKEEEENLRLKKEYSEQSIKLEQVQRNLEKVQDLVSEKTLPPEEIVGKVELLKKEEHSTREKLLELAKLLSLKETEIQDHAIPQVASSLIKNISGLVKSLKQAEKQSSNYHKELVDIKNQNKNLNQKLERLHEMLVQSEKISEAVKVREEEKKLLQEEIEKLQQQVMGSKKDTELLEIVTLEKNELQNERNGLAEKITLLEQKVMTLEEVVKNKKLGPEEAQKIIQNLEEQVRQSNEELENQRKGSLELKENDIRRTKELENVKSKLNEIQSLISGKSTTSLSENNIVEEIKSTREKILALAKSLSLNDIKLQGQSMPEVIVKVGEGIANLAKQSSVCSKELVNIKGEIVDLKEVQLRLTNELNHVKEANERVKLEKEESTKKLMKDLESKEIDNRQLKKSVEELQLQLHETVQKGQEENKRLNHEDRLKIEEIKKTCQGVVNVKEDIAMQEIKLSQVLEKVKTKQQNLHQKQQKLEHRQQDIEKKEVELKELELYINDEKEKQHERISKIDNQRERLQKELVNLKEESIHASQIQEIKYQNAQKSLQVVNSMLNLPQDATPIQVQEALEEKLRIKNNLERPQVSSLETIDRLLGVESPQGAAKLLEEWSKKVTKYAWPCNNIVCAFEQMVDEKRRRFDLKTKKAEIIKKIPKKKIEADFTNTQMLMVMLNDSVKELKSTKTNEEKVQVLEESLQSLTKLVVEQEDTIKHQRGEITQMTSDVNLLLDEKEKGMGERILGIISDARNKEREARVKTKLLRDQHTHLVNQLNKAMGLTTERESLQELEKTSQIVADIRQDRPSIFINTMPLSTVLQFLYQEYDTEERHHLRHQSRALTDQRMLLIQPLKLQPSGGEEEKEEAKRPKRIKDQPLGAMTAASASASVTGDCGEAIQKWKAQVSLDPSNAPKRLPEKCYGDLNVSALDVQLLSKIPFSRVNSHKVASIPQEKLPYLNWRTMQRESCKHFTPAQHKYLAEHPQINAIYKSVCR